MPRVGTVGAIRIYIYGLDHNPPHLHAIIAERQAEIGITDLRVFSSNLKPKELQRVLAWAETNQVALLREWHHAEKGEEVNPV